MPAKEDIGNLNNNKLYKELDPTNKLSLCKDDKKGQQAYYKGKKMKYLDYMQEVTDRIERKKKNSRRYHNRYENSKKQPILHFFQF